MYVSFRFTKNVSQSLSGTTDAMGYYFLDQGRKIYLIDTPGFDDTDIDNASVFRKISTFLCTVCDGQCVVLGGMIYVQRITDMRMSGSSLNSLHIFEKICGEHCFENVVIVTTMWSMLKTKEARDAAIVRESMLKERPEFFGKLTKAHAQMVRYEDSHDSALHVIELLALANRQRRVNLLLQKEMKRRETMTLGETTAGRYLEGELANTRKKLERDKQEWEELEPEACDDKEAIAEQVRDHARRVHQIQIDQGSLSITLEDMEREQKEWCMRKDDEDLQKAVTEGKSAVVLKLEDQVQRWKREAQEERQEKHAQREVMNKKLEAVQKELEDQKKSEQAAREKAEKAKFARGPFFVLMKQALGFANPVKEPKDPGQPLSRSNSMPPVDAKPTRRSSSKPTRKGTRSKKSPQKSKSSARYTPSPEEIAEYQYAAHQNPHTQYPYGYDQAYDQGDGSESDEDSEAEDPGPATHTPQAPQPAHYLTQTVVPSYSNEKFAYIPAAQVVKDASGLLRNPPPPVQPLPRKYANENSYNRHFPSRSDSNHDSR
jgi:hypothetical protein